MLTVLSTLGPHRLDAGRCIVTSRFRCRSFDRRYVVGALSTGRCLPAVAPRVLIMGDEVRSRSLSPDSHFHRFQVTALHLIWEGKIIDAIFRRGKRHSNYGRAGAKMT